MPKRRMPESIESLKNRIIRHREGIDQKLKILIPEVERRIKRAEESRGGSLEDLASGKLPRRSSPRAKTGWSRNYEKGYDEIFGKNRKKK
ncbi:MAG: hypothetical protein ABIE23_00220 [archaeon]|nr:hypothetical protein [Candidatus Micrarchaeota archaeon]